MWKSGLALQTTDYSMRRLFVGLFQIIYCPAHLTDCCRDECVDQSGTWSDICSFPLSRITRWNHIFFYNIRRPVVLLLLLELPRWLRAWKGGNVFTHLVRKKMNICSLVVWEAFDGLIQFATGIIGIQWNQHELKLTTLNVLIKRLTKRDEFFKGKWFRQEYQLNVCADVFRVPVSLIAVAVSYSAAMKRLMSLQLVYTDVILGGRPDASLRLHSIPATGASPLSPGVSHCTAPHRALEMLRLLSGGVKVTTAPLSGQTLSFLTLIFKISAGL